MKAEELRIGNYVLMPSWREDGLSVKKIETISKGWTLNSKGSEYGYCVNHCYPETGYEFSVPEKELEPIPLTEEWLVRFGFDLETYKGISCIDSPNDMFYSLIRRGNYFYPYETDNVIQFKLQYVHQLQNLYFALTGEELKLKEA